MNKKLLAVAVASALAVPVTASAQVTISGIFKVGISNISMGGTVTPGRANDSQLRVDDNSSRILFNVTEDLGGGLAAIGQLDLRFAPDQAGSAPVQQPDRLGQHLRRSAQHQLGHDQPRPLGPALRQPAGRHC